LEDLALKTFNVLLIIVNQDHAVIIQLEVPVQLMLNVRLIFVMLKIHQDQINAQLQTQTDHNAQDSHNAHLNIVKMEFVQIKT